jgi:hypothetical protein
VPERLDERLQPLRLHGIQADLAQQRGEAVGTLSGTAPRLSAAVRARA